MKTLWRVIDVFVTVILISVIVSSAYIAVSARRSTDSIPTVFGHKILTVLSGSMAPAIRTGDVILVQSLVSGQDVSEGDIITFRPIPKAKMLITHRVVGVIYVNGTPAQYITKGDANSGEDTPVAPAQIVGRYRARVPLLGYVADFIRRPLGIVLVVIVPGVLLITMEIRRLWKITVALEAQKSKSAGTKAG